MTIDIEKAIHLAKKAVSQNSSLSIGDATALIGQIVSARHSSNYGESGDRWIILFRLDWGDDNISPNSMVVYVDSSTEDVAFRPVF